MKIYKPKKNNILSKIKDLKNNFIKLFNKNIYVENNYVNKKNKTADIKFDMQNINNNLENIKKSLEKIDQRLNCIEILCSQNENISRINCRKRYLTGDFKVKYT